MQSLCLGEFPCASQDFRLRAEQTHGVVPTLRDREAIWSLAVAAPELDVNRTIGTFLCGEAVQRVGLIGVRLEIALAVVNRDRPETIDRDILDRQPVNGFTIIARRRDRQINGILFGIAAP